MTTGSAIGACSVSYLLTFILSALLRSEATGAAPALAIPATRVVWVATTDAKSVRQRRCCGRRGSGDNAQSVPTFPDANPSQLSIGKIM
jgi:hypothetical protein